MLEKNHETQQKWSPDKNYTRRVEIRLCLWGGAVDLGTTSLEACGTHHSRRHPESWRTRTWSICNSWKIPNKNAKYDGRSNTGSFNLPSGSKLYVLRVLILESWQPGTEEPNHRTRVLKEGKRNGLRWDTGHCQGVNTEGGNSSDFYGLQVLNFSK